MAKFKTQQTIFQQKYHVQYILPYLLQILIVVRVIEPFFHLHIFRGEVRRGLQINIIPHIVRSVQYLVFTHIFLFVLTWIFSITSQNTMFFHIICLILIIYMLVWNERKIRYNSSKLLLKFFNIILFG